MYLEILNKKINEKLNEKLNEIARAPILIHLGFFLHEVQNRVLPSFLDEGFAFLARRGPHVDGDLMFC